MVKKIGGETREARITRSIEEKVCATCGKSLLGVRILGSGSFSDGLFCSLDCYALCQADLGSSLVDHKSNLH